MREMKEILKRVGVLALSVMLAVVSSNLTTVAAEPGADATTPAETSAAAQSATDPAKASASVTESETESEEGTAEESEEEEETTETEEETEDEEKEEPTSAFSETARIDGVTIRVTAAEGVFPKGATLSVSKAEAAEEAAAESAVDDVRSNNKNVAASYTYDIKVLDKDGNEIQPADSDKVKISFTLSEVADSNLSTDIYHIKEDAEALSVSESGSTATAETDGFSLYTVEFTYTDKQYVLSGDSEVALADILEAVGLSGEVSAVSVSDDTLFSASQNEGGQWIVTAHKAFDTEEWMKVTINGTEYEIKVTDDSQQIATGTCGSGVTWTVYENGLLAITGSGDMDDINGAGNQPWVSYGSQITSISIGSGVTKVGTSAFSQLDNVTTVTFENGSTCSSIGGQAFYDCDALTSISIPASVTSIGANAFEQCSVLSTVTFDGISACSSIGAYAFCETGLTSVSIPDSVTSMGKYTFYRCLSLATVTIGNGLEVIPDHAFAQCRALTTLQIGNHVTTIDKYAFSRCEVLPSVQFPNSLTSIKEGAFQSCAALATVTIPAGVTSITEQAFTFCTNLQRVIMLGNTPPDLLDGDGNLITEAWRPVFSPVGDQAYRYSGEICIPAGAESAYASNTSWVGYASKVVPRRSVTLNVNNKGTISSDQIYTINSAKYATVGKTVTINGTPDSGFALTDLTVTKSDSTTVDVSGTGNTRTFTMPDDSVTIHAVFSAPLVASDITVENMTYNGGNRVVTVKRGTTTLTPNTDYTVVYKQNDVVVTPHDAGEYTAVITGVGDYGGTVNKTFTISKAPLTVTAKPKTITYGDAPANDSVTYSGFVGGENADVLSGTLGYTYNYSQYGNVGSYTITPGGLTSDNYDITFTSGVLTVNPKEVGLTWGNSTFTYDGLSHVPSCTATGMVNGDVITATVSGAETNASNSDYTATAIALVGSKADNYVLPTVCTNSFRINQANAEIIIASGKDSYDKHYGDSTFALTGISTNLGVAPSYEVTSGADVVSLSGNTITILKPGIATITVSLAGTTNYTAAGNRQISISVANGAAPAQPAATMTTAYANDTVSKVTLPTGWTWAANDRDTVLTVGTAVIAHAEYTAADEAYYDGGKSLDIAITRLEQPSSSSGSSGTSSTAAATVSTSAESVDIGIFTMPVAGAGAATAVTRRIAATDAGRSTNMNSTDEALPEQEIIDTANNDADKPGVLNNSKSNTDEEAYDDGSVGVNPIWYLLPIGIFAAAGVYELNQVIRRKKGILKKDK